MPLFPYSRIGQRTPNIRLPRQAAQRPAPWGGIASPQLQSSAQVGLAGPQLQSSSQIGLAGPQIQSSSQTGYANPTGTQSPYVPGSIGFSDPNAAYRLPRMDTAPSYSPPTGILPGMQQSMNQLPTGMDFYQNDMLGAMFNPFDPSGIQYQGLQDPLAFLWGNQPSMPQTR